MFHTATLRLSILAMTPALALAAAPLQETAPKRQRTADAPQRIVRAELDQTPILEREVIPTVSRPDGTIEPAHIADQVLVRFVGGLDADQRAQLLGDRFAIERELAQQINLTLVQVLDGTSLEAAMDELSAKDGILYAVPDHIVTNRDTFPNDSAFPQQYGKHNTGQTGGTPDADIDAPGAWDIGTGTADFAVAIVDGGTQHSHTDLIGNRWENTAEVNGQPGVDDDGNGYVDDRFGWNAFNNNGNVPGSTHGTHVAGIAAAQGNNGVGVAGVSWDSEIVSIAGSSGSTSTVVAAYSYALKLKDDWIASGGTEGARIVAINSSFGVDFANCNSNQFAPWNDMMDTLGQSGILSIGATANNSVNIDNVGDVPTGCSSDYLIAVTNTNDRDNRAFAGFGLTTIDLGAPGSSIRSTVTGNGYGTLSGTSMATPQVTGAVALLHSNASSSFDALRTADPAAAALEIKRILLDTVDVVSSLDGSTVSGGRLNVHAASIEISSFDQSSVNYCGPANGNSLGLAGQIAYEGSTDVALNDFRLAASNLPPNSTSLFLASTQQGFVANPAGSAGNLCLSGSIGRFITQIGPSGGAGNFVNTVDLTAIPQPNGPFAVTPGSTVYFQCWHRDNLLGFSTSNFTDGLAVTFQ